MMRDQIVELLAACFLVLGFIYIIRALKLVARARSVIAEGGHSLDVIFDNRVDDKQKEAALKQGAAKLFAHFVGLTLGGTLALILPVAVVWFADYLGLLSLQAVLGLTLSWQFILGATAAGTGLLALTHHKETAEAARFEVRYSGADRLVHKIAFTTQPTQIWLSKFEDSLFGEKFATPTVAPVFIASLPRAGTTLLLELLFRTSEFASHTYRHMPFVLMPALWERLSSSFKKHDVPRERAHGDGMMVTLDSPEALEEMLWLQYFPKHYRKQTILPWDGNCSPEFDAFFQRHRDKIAALCRMEAGITGIRYASKNNLNIARIDYLVASIPDCRIIVPFRDPCQHAVSMLRQHLNFREIHSGDDFTRQYMAGIGHFDFGHNLKPVNFDNWLQTTPHKDTASFPFWLAYWEATFTHLLTHDSDRLIFCDYDMLCVNPAVELERLAEFIGMNDKSRLLSQTDQIRIGGKVSQVADQVGPQWRDRINKVHLELKKRASTAVHHGGS